MDTLQRIADILGVAERGLADLGGEAAREGSYEHASALIELAKEVSALTHRARNRLEPSASPAVPVQVNGSIRAVNLSKRTKSRKDYPVFIREGESLVKIAWSRKEKKEYEHKCPHKVVPLLAAMLTRTGTNGKRFGMEQLLPLTDQEGATVPDYQAYLVLAWFRALGFVIQHGRQGYTLATRAPLESLVDTHWNSLSSR